MGFCILIASPSFDAPASLAPVGGKWIYFDPSEVSRFGTEGVEEHHGASGGLVLLGFKDAERLKLHHNLGANKFVQPTERVPGSCAAMRAWARYVLPR